MTQSISIALLDYNKGQLKGLPKNPRFFRDYRFEAMKKSIEVVKWRYATIAYIVIKR